MSQELQELKREVSRLRYELESKTDCNYRYLDTRIDDVNRTVSSLESRIMYIQETIKEAARDFLCTLERMG